MKYKIVIYKEEKQDERAEMFGIPANGIFGRNNGREIFSAEMISDHTIEVLQHLYDLQTRKIVD
jgi:hypothetical protein